MLGHAHRAAATAMHSQTVSSCFFCTVQRLVGGLDHLVRTALLALSLRHSDADGHRDLVRRRRTPGHKAATIILRPIVFVTQQKGISLHRLAYRLQRTEKKQAELQSQMLNSY